MNFIRIALQQIGNYRKERAEESRKEKEALAFRLYMGKQQARKQADREEEQRNCPHKRQSDDYSAMVWVENGQYLICQHCQVIKRQDWSEFARHFSQVGGYGGHRGSYAPRLTKKQQSDLDKAYKMPMDDLYKAAMRQAWGR